MKNDETLVPRLHSVLVPIEINCECSKKALQYAVPFARSINARIILLNVLPDHCLPSSTFNPIKLQWVSEENERADVQAQLERLAAEIVPEDIPVEKDVDYGTPAIAIVNQALMRDVDLIVISTHAHRGLMHLLTGSVASRVSRLAPCPVLVVREREHEFVLPDPHLSRLAPTIPGLSAMSGPNHAGITPMAGEGHPQEKCSQE